MSGLTQAQLANLAGVGKTVVFDIEHGKQSVRFDTLSKILEVLNISISFQSPLLERSEAAGQKAASSPPGAQP